MVKALALVAAAELLVTALAAACSAARPADGALYALLTAAEVALAVAGAAVYAMRVPRAQRADRIVRRVLAYAYALDAAYVAAALFGWAWALFRTRAQGRKLNWRRALILSTFGSGYILLVFATGVGRQKSVLREVDCRPELEPPRLFTVALVVTMVALVCVLGAVCAAECVRNARAKLVLYVVAVLAAAVMANFAPSVLFSLTGAAQKIKLKRAFAAGQGLRNEILRNPCYFRVAADGALLIIPPACAAIFKLMRAVTAQVDPDALVKSPSAQFAAGDGVQQNL